MPTLHFITLLMAFILFQSAVVYGYFSVRALSADQRAIFTPGAGARWFLFVLFAVFLTGVWVDDPLLKLLLMFLPMIIFTGSGFGSVKKLKASGFSLDFVRRISRANFMFYGSALGFATYVCLTIFYACSCTVDQ